MAVQITAPPPLTQELGKYANCSFVCAILLYYHTCKSVFNHVKTSITMSENVFRSKIGECFEVTVLGGGYLLVAVSLQGFGFKSPCSNKDSSSRICIILIFFVFAKNELNK